MKKITIKSCKECPYSKESVTVYPKLPRWCNHPNLSSETWIENPDKFPSFCPLEDSTYFIEHEFDVKIVDAEKYKENA